MRLRKGEKLRTKCVKFIKLNISKYVSQSRNSNLHIFKSNTRLSTKCKINQLSSFLVVVVENKKETDST